MPDSHALLGPSSAHRWLACPPSARLEEHVADAGSEYAREGTLAHRLAELRLRERFDLEHYDPEALIEVTQDPLYSGEMWEHATAYMDFISERMADAKSRDPVPSIYIEQEIHFEDYVPGGFGTSDCVILADAILDVIDFKYGRGVPVSAEDNPQMKMYALGSYLATSWAYDVAEIRMTIFQPRLDSVSTATISVKDLMFWAENELKPRADQAWKGEGDFCPGEEACRWCKVAATCRARSDYQLNLAKFDFSEPKLLTMAEIAEILTRLPDFLSWADQVKAYANYAAVNAGVVFPGFKVVEGRSTRKYSDEKAIAALLKKAGYKVGEIYKPKEPLGITAMEKLVGKKTLEELIGKFIVKPEGAPTLVPESDKRPAINTAAQAAEDFKEEM